MRMRVIVIIIGFAILTIGIGQYDISSGSIISCSFFYEPHARYNIHDPILIEGNSNFTIENGVTSGNGTKGNPYLIENWSINASSGDGISIRNTTVYFIIKNCHIIYGLQNFQNSGIHLSFVTNCQVENNVIKYFKYGVYLKNCSYGGITKNNCSNNYWAGIYVLDHGLNLITDNHCTYNNWFGIHISDSINNTISRNNCSDNQNGIQLGQNSNNNYVAVNLVTSNEMYGIWIFGSNDNKIVHNNIYNNGNFGLICSFGAKNNLIYHNNLINNGEHSSQGYDEQNNNWATSSGGNFWSDYEGSDEDEDGFGDEHYEINGSSSPDEYPIITPKNNLYEDIGKRISVKLILDHDEYDNGTNISGKLRIINNNVFDAYTVIPDSYGENITLLPNIAFEIMDIDTKNLMYSFETKILQINNHSEYEMQFILTGFYETKKWSSQHIPLIAGDYLIHSSFIIYIDTNLYYEIDSNTEFFTVISDLTGIENIEIKLQLDKSKYTVGEPLSGSVTIINNNSFSIELNSNIPQSLLVGSGFQIYNKDRNQTYSPHYYYIFPEVKAEEELETEFKFDKFFKHPLDLNNSLKTDLSIGNYSMYIYCYYGNNSNLERINSNIITFEVISNISGIEDDYPPGFDLNNDTISFRNNVVYGSLATLSIVIIVVLTTFVTATEIGKYGFFTAIAPLYSRKKKHGEEYTYNKGKVHGYILGNPGDSYNSIKRVLSMPNGTLAYYLKVLEKEGSIKSERDGYFKRFYPVGYKITEDVLELNEIQNEMLSIINTTPGISQKEIATKLGITLQRVNYNTKMMSDARLIKVERDGKRTKCFTIDETPSQLSES